MVSFTPAVKNPKEVSSASIYMAIKFLEKESNGKYKLMSRALFEQILLHNDCHSEQKALECAS
jgi:hypothetical protein